MSNENINVLVVEDEESIRKFITINLDRNGFGVIEAATGEEAMEVLKEHAVRVVILDIMLPGIDGLEVCRRIRELNLDVVIVMLTAKGQDMDKIMGLELGADDYMVKPFNPLELIARIRAILRRSVKPAEQMDVISRKHYVLDIRAQKFYKNGLEVEVTPREFSCLKFFMENAGKALSRDELLNEVWGKHYFGDIKTVDVHIRRIREKVEDKPSAPSAIETVWGYGYRWRIE